MEVREVTHPDDKYNLVYLIFLLHGLGVLLPWNMFITAKSYFVDHKLAHFVEAVITTTITSEPTPSSLSTVSTFSNETTLSTMFDETATILSSIPTTHSDTTDALNAYQIGFMSAIGVAANIPNVLFNGVNLFIQTNRGNIEKRITAMILAECMILFITILMIFIDTSDYVSAFYYFTLVTIAIMNMANGVYQSSVFGLVAPLPKSYSGAIILGNNLCGTLVSIISIISKAISAEPRSSAAFYFCSTLAVLILCLITLHMLKRNEYYRHFDQLRSSTEIAEQQEKLENPPEEKVTQSKIEIYKEVFNENWSLFLNIFMVFFVTLSVFPEVTSNTLSSGQLSGLGDFFTAIACFLCFNFFALLGSYLPRFFDFPDSKYMWIPVFGRLLFFPFFLMCNYNPSIRRSSVVIPNDWVFVLGVTLLGLTSGYYSALVFKYLPGNEKKHGASASMLAAFFLVLGVFIGVCFSSVWQFVA